MKSNCPSGEGASWAIGLVWVIAVSLGAFCGGGRECFVARLQAAEAVSGQRDHEDPYQAPSRDRSPRVILVVDSSARPIQPDRAPAAMPGNSASSVSPITLRALSAGEATPNSVAAPRQESPVGEPRRLNGGATLRLAASRQSEAPPVRSPVVPSPPEVVKTPAAEAPAAEKTPRAEFDLDSRPISAVTTNIQCQQGHLPEDAAQAKLATMRTRPYNNLADREWEELGYLWEAPALRHQPLYFEEVNLERYGYCWPGLKPIQPALSAGQFFGTLPLLPYKMWCEPPLECDYTLGQYRPGSPAPYRVQLPCWRPGAGAAEAGTVAGLILLIP